MDVNKPAWSIAITLLREIVEGVEVFTVQSIKTDLYYTMPQTTPMPELPELSDTLSRPQVNTLKRAGVMITERLWPIRMPQWPEGL